MEVQWLLVCHGIFTSIVVISFLCGQWPIFQGTPIQRIHHFITFGAYDYLLRFVGFACGSKGTNAILSAEYFCCDRPNPILQVIYLAILGGTYFIVAKSCFTFIPGYYLSEIHWYTSLLAVSVGVLLFILTSFTDPGTITAENVSQYIAAYPYDNVIYSEKMCSTCKIPKPARSKHCGICGRCVARFDHHCGWMNNCIGERNNHYFLTFIIWHFLLCVYGTVVIGLILAGRMKELRVIYILTVYYEIDSSFRSLAPHVVQWLLSSYSTQILLMVFLAIVSLLLAGLFAYHAKLCLTNTTTNEELQKGDPMGNNTSVNNACVYPETDWEGLPHNLLDNILKKLESQVDYIQFGVVCVSWRSVWEFNAVSGHHHPPVLMVPAKAHKIKNAWRIYDVALNKFIGRWVYVPANIRYMGYSHGLLLTLSAFDGSVIMYRPLSMTYKSAAHASVEKKKKRKGVARTIHLPDLNFYRELPAGYYSFGIRKTLITAEPNECVVVLIGTCGLAFLRLGRDSSWTKLLGPDFEGLVDVVILDDNRMYAIKGGFPRSDVNKGSMISFEISDSISAVDEVASTIQLCPNFSGLKFFCHRYLVRSPCSKDLLQVERYVELRRTVSFRVFKFAGKDKGWVRVMRLEDTCLFVGDSSSISIQCSRFSGYRSNCVYFTHHTTNECDFHWTDLDMGIYDLGTNKFERNDPLVLDTIDFGKSGPPFWVVPTSYEF